MNAVNMLKINKERFLEMMHVQAQIGATVEGGLSRPSLSDADKQIRDWFEAQIKKNALIYAEDGAGNQSAILKCEQEDAKTLLIGSHFDSVPNGGRFDGALGVIAAFEAQLTLKDANEKLPFHLEVINFTDEEGTLVGLLGSSAVAGLLTSDALQNPRGGRGKLEAGMARFGYTDESMLSVKRDSETLAGYVEVHIEQGTRLEDAKLDIGVVTSIVGIRSMWVTFSGEAAHAGTMPMDKRKDAFWGAAQFALKARDIIIQDFQPGVVNFGDVEIEPAAFNIVPERVNIGVEFRHGDVDSLDRMEAMILDIAQETAQKLDLTVSARKLHDIQPAPMDTHFVTAVDAACDTLGLSHTQLLSFAGHDAQSMAQITKSVMFFVPSVDGISHNPREFTRDADCINAANVMLHTILQLRE